MGRCETFLNIVMKINVIFTGGTIGSSHSDGYITPDPAAKYRLIKNYQKAFGTSVEFTVCNPYTILSENLSGKTLSLLMKSIKEGLEDNCDGIIVAHGTDTLQYSAIAAAYCFGSNTKPIMFVSLRFSLFLKVGLTPMFVTEGYFFPSTTVNDAYTPNWGTAKSSSKN